MARHAGVLVPLFSIPSRAGWGIGDIADLRHLGAWLAAGGFDRLMLLPLGTMPAGETSPYSAMSTMAIDPMYVAVHALGDFARAGGVASLSAEARAAIEAARRGARVRYVEVRRAKDEALAAAYEYFLAADGRRGSTRAADFGRYIARESWWLDDYARFVAVAEAEGTHWRDWPAPLRDREPLALADVDRRFNHVIRREQYRQWIAESQWQDARRLFAGLGVEIIGDLPFGLGVNSPDVWARSGEFDLAVSVGVPPDAFSESGQDWRLPMYRWDAIAQADFEMLRRRGRRMAALYSGFRMDHLVGYFRTYGRPASGEPFFIPAAQADQIAQGERAVAALRSGGAQVLAEDLGVVPDFVRDTMARLALPGCKVMRWERDWHAEGHPYVDPREYPACSMTVTGTHDLEPLAVWWSATGAGERDAIVRLPQFVESGVDAATPWSAAVRDRLLAAAYASASDDLFLPLQDVFGWPDRINTPATISPDNWTWKLPWPIEDWPRVPDAVSRAAFCRAQAAAQNRGQASAL